MFINCTLRVYNLHKLFIYLDEINVQFKAIFVFKLWKFTLESPEYDIFMHKKPEFTHKKQKELGVYKENIQNKKLWNMLYIFKNNRQSYLMHYVRNDKIYKILHPAPIFSLNYRPSKWSERDVFIIWYSCWWQTQQSVHKTGVDLIKTFALIYWY